MALAVDVNVHTVRRLPIADGQMLPALDAPDHRPAAIDLVGAAVRARGWLIVLGVVTGGVVGATTSVGVVSTALAGGVAGFVLAYVRSVMIGLRLGPYRGRIEEAPQIHPESIRVVEYNVHGGMGGPGQFFATRRKLDHLAATVRSVDPDIVLVQELDQFAARSNFTDTLAQMVRRLEPTGAVMTPAAEKVYGRREGTGVLTFKGVTITDARGLRIADVFGDGTFRRICSAAAMWAGVIGGPAERLLRRGRPVTEFQPRAATDVMIVTPAGNRVRVMSGHFSSPHDGIDEPERQVRPVVDTVSSWAGPTIVGADFNVRDGSVEFVREIALFASVGMAESTHGSPANSDRIYATAHFVASNPRKLEPQDGAPPASDHAPVVVDLRLS